jgi:hypothetical protein
MLGDEQCESIVSLSVAAITSRPIRSFSKSVTQHVHRAVVDSRGLSMSSFSFWLPAGASWVKPFAQICKFPWT